MYRPRPFKCYECDCSGAETKYYNIFGDTYCQDCADEYIKDEITENLKEYRDDLFALIGIQVLEAFE